MYNCYIPISEMGLRWDGNYYDPEAILVRNKIRDCGITLQSLSEISEEIFSGPFGSNLTVDNYVQSGLPIIRPVNLTEGFNSGNLVHMDKHLADEKGLKLVNQNTLLFARVGDPAVGKLPSDMHNATISPNIIASRMNDQNHLFYTLAFFSTQSARKLLDASVKRVTQPTVGVEEIGAIMIPVPSKSLRSAIGNKVHAAEKLTAIAEKQYQRAINNISKYLPDKDLVSPNQISPIGSDTFSIFVDNRELKSFIAAQFFAPLRRKCLSILQTCNCPIIELSIKAKRKHRKINNDIAYYVNPSKVSSGDGYWVLSSRTEVSSVVQAKPGNVIFLRMRPYLNKTTIVDIESPVQTSSEYYVYEFASIEDAFFTTLCLRQPWVLGQIIDLAKGDRPRVDAEFVSKIIIPWPAKQERQIIGTLYQQFFVNRRRSEKLVLEAISDVERMIGGSLTETECLTQGRQLAEEFGLEQP